MSGSGNRCFQFRSLIVLIGVAFTSSTFGDVPAVPLKEAHRPSAMPDRVILTWAGDPATSQAVTWRTSTDVAKGIAQFAVATPNKNFTEHTTDVTAETQPFESELGSCHYHTAKFENLAPKTKYAFRVGDGTNWTEWSHFVTPSKEAEPFSFVYFGDAQVGVKTLWSRVIREAFRDPTQPRFFLHAGDLINSANADDEWGDWHRAGGWANMMLPTIATPGNHEYGLQTKPAPPAYRLTPFWRAQFAFPSDGPNGLEETVYYLDYQGTRIVSLNSNQDITQQVPWLEKTLADNPNRWTIVTFHHPIFSAAKMRDNPIIRKMWQPVFDKYKVDLVLQGHDHAYARTGLETAQKNVPTGQSAQSGPGGTVYVVSVSGPKMYGVDRDARMHRAGANLQLYQTISIDGDQLRYQAITAIGQVYDAFTLKKKNGAPNELIEQIPDVPEQLK